MAHLVSRYYVVNILVHVSIALSAQVSASKPCYSFGFDRNAPSYDRCAKGATYIGCYNVNASFPAVSNDTTSPTMSMEECFEWCLDDVYPYAGLFNGSQCLCSCFPPIGERLLLDDKCGVPCPGSVFHFCGGVDTVQIYEALSLSQAVTTAEPTNKLTLRDMDVRESVIVECTAANTARACVSLQYGSGELNFTSFGNWKVFGWLSPTAGDNEQKYFEVSLDVSSLGVSLPNPQSNYCRRSSEANILKVEVTISLDLNFGPSCEDMKYLCIQLEDKTREFNLCHVPSDPICKMLACGENLVERLNCGNNNCTCIPRAVIYPSRNLASVEKLTIIEQLNVTTETADEVLDEVISITDSDDVGSEEFSLATNVLETVVALKSPDAKITTDVVTIIDNLLGSDPEYLREAQERNRSGSRAMQAMEEQLDIVDLTKTNGSFKVVKPNLGVEVKKTSRSTLQSGLTFVSNGSDVDAALTEGDIGIVDKFPLEDDTYSRPVEAAVRVQSYSPLTDDGVQNASDANVSEVRVAFSIVRLPKVFDVGDDPNIDEECPLPGSTRRPNTPVVSVTVRGSRKESLSSNVTTIFREIEKSNETTVIDDPVCVFWDYEADTGRGAWSSFGCTLVKMPSNDSMIVCQCNHTTNFAVLMRVHTIKISDNFEKASRFLTYIGCSLSIVSLVVTLAVYLFSSKLRQKQPNQIFMNICAALLLLYVLFVIVIAMEHGQQHNEISETDVADEKCKPNQSARREVWCYVIAALAQYFTLSTLAWMAVEGFNMYLLFVRVVNSHINKFMLKASIFAWGFPAFVVIITGAVAQNKFVHDNVCFIALKPKIYGLLIPVGIILAINLIIYITVLVRLSRTLSAKKGKSSEAWQRLQKALCIFLLLGLTWSFGYLLLINHTSNQIFQILFIVFNSFQGFLIFVLYCLRQQLVRQEMARCCVCFAFCAPGAGHRLGSSIRLQSRSTRSTLDRSGIDSTETASSYMENLPRSKRRFSFFHKYF